jgi:hypothetical protein
MYINHPLFDFCMGYQKKEANVLLGRKIKSIFF